MRRLDLRCLIVFLKIVDKARGGRATGEI